MSTCPLHPDVAHPCHICGMARVRPLAGEVVYAHRPIFTPYVDPLPVKHPRTELKGWLTIHARRRRRATA